MTDKVGGQWPYFSTLDYIPLKVAEGEAMETKRFLNPHL
jgi:hypothetical protein